MAGRGVWRRRVAARAAEEFGGVVSRSVLRQHAVTHDDVRSEVRAHRWTALGRHTVFLGDLAAAGVDPVCGPDGPVARAWWAVWESGSGAMLDGVSALIAAGMTGFTTDAVHVSLSTSSAFYPLPRVVPHWPTRRIRQPGGGLPRTVPELATLHAATWAVSDRQAALLVAMPVQQRLVNAPRLLELWRTVRRSDRRELLDGIIGDVCDGAHSLGELDVAGLCRRYGLPQPTRQAVRTERKGRVYLDSSGRSSASPQRWRALTTRRGSMLSMTPCGRTRCPSSAMSSSGSRCWGCGWTRRPSWPSWRGRFRPRLGAGDVRWPLGLRPVRLRPVRLRPVGEPMWPGPGDLSLLKGRHR
ncbi:MAG: hypothetical protein M3424_01105 [Actinomycetota bacterium]|nr:hypothetical protein [Actinomycetota bacterium]